ncbi:MAG: RNA methyltransferase [Thermoprotei archaeon]|nr:TrmJ/YjtD family RNA methyltransferase [TACK group archaeon]
MNSLSNVYVILVQPTGEFNVGLAARASANFGVAGLRIVNAPLGVSSSSLRYSSGGRELLQNAPLYRTLDEAIQDLDYAIATTARTGGKRNVLRETYRPSSILPYINSGKKVGLVFGREDRGLTNEELVKCDFAVTIEAYEGYPVLNLSHAVAVLLHYLFISASQSTPKRHPALGPLRAAFMDQFSKLMKNSGYPERKWDETWLTMRRVLVRADPDEWELALLTGALRAANRALSGDIGEAAEDHQLEKG